MVTGNGLLAMVISVAAVGAISAISPCSETNRSTNLTSCLQEIKGQFFDDKLFWFGEQYKTDCPEGNENGDIVCNNPANIDADNIGRRLSMIEDDVGLIDRFLSVRYSHDAGSYTGCGFEVKQQGWESDIDPLSGDRITAWNTRMIPDFQFDASDNEYFAVIFYDAGKLRYNGVFINLQGNTINEEHILKAYEGPANPFTRRNPYVFLLFKQVGRVQIIKENLNETSRVMDFAKANNFTGPVAVNWVSVEGDLYSAEQATNDPKALYMCPLFVKEALDETAERYPYIPKPPSILSVLVDITLTSKPIIFKLCCRDFVYKSTTIRINPYTIGNVFTGMVMTDSTRAIKLRKAGAYAKSNDFGDDLFTLLVVDVGCNGCNTTEGPRLHNLVVNIRDGSVSTGNVVMPYTGLNCPSVSPLDLMPHRLYYLLFRQDARIEAKDGEYIQMSRYVSNCQEDDSCLFRVDEFMEDHNVTLVGANTFTAFDDEFSLHRRLVARNDSSITTRYCKVNSEMYPKYAEPCLEDSATRLANSNSLALCLLVTVFLMYY